MSHEPAKAMGGGLFGGLMGAGLGVLLGGMIGAASLTMPNSLAGNSDPLAQTGSKVFGAIDGCLGFLGMLMGAAIGGPIGAIVGSMLGAGAAVGVGRHAQNEVGVTPFADSGSGEESDEELARLKQRIAELEQAQQVAKKPIPAKAQAPDVSASINYVDWQVLRESPLGVCDEPAFPNVFPSEVQAEAAARGLIRDNPDARVFVVGPKGCRYRVLP